MNTQTVTCPAISGCCRFSVTLFSLVLAAASSTAVAQDLDTLGDWNSALGSWDQQYHAITALSLPTGKILIWELDGQTARLWNPADGGFTNVGTNELLFCSGHAGLANGTVLVAGGGGHGGAADVTDANIFNIFGPGDPWDTVTDMHLPRFYPTCTTLPDGRVLTAGGFRGLGEDIPEIFNPSAETWQQLPFAGRHVGLYPFMFVLGNGNVFLAGANEPASDFSSILYLDFPPAFWDDVGTNPLSGNYSSAVMYAPDVVLISGGEPDGVVTDETARFDFNQPIPQWETLPSPMVERRRHHDLVVLPTGHVLAVGGENDNGPVFDAEWFDPDPLVEAWTRLATMTQPRGEHSTAVLLADATVLVAGDEDNPPPSAEIFSPPYLFSGNSLAPRPEIGYVSQRVTYGTNFRVIFSVGSPVTPSGIGRVTLVRLAAVTHGFDQNQRFVELEFEVLGSDSLNVTPPASPNYAPPGYYMLFLITSDGVPSKAEYIRLS